MLLQPNYANPILRSYPIHLGDNAQYWLRGCREAEGPPVKLGFGTSTTLNLRVSQIRSPRSYFMGKYSPGAINVCASPPTPTPNTPKTKHSLTRLTKFHSIHHPQNRAAIRRLGDINNSRCVLCAIVVGVKCTHAIPPCGSHVQSIAPSPLPPPHSNPEILVQYVARSPSGNLEKSFVLTATDRTYSELRLLKFMTPPEMLDKGFTLWASTTKASPETVHGRPAGGNKLLQGTGDVAYVFRVYMAPAGGGVDKGVRMFKLPLPVSTAPVRVADETKLLVFQQPVRTR